MSNVPSNIKSGFSLNEHDPRIQFYIDNFETVLSVLTQKSIIYAVHYSKTAQRTNLSGMDMIYSLQFLAHEFVNDVSIDELKDDKNNMFLTDSESEYEESEYEGSDSSYSTEQDVVINEGSDIFTRANDEDELCAKMNFYHDTWDSWTTNDVCKTMLKNAVDKMIKTYK